MRCVVLALLFGGLGLAGSAHAQEPKPRTIPFEGAEVFSHILFHEGLKPIVTPDDLAADPRDSLLIVFGRPDRVQEINAAMGSLKNFLKQGGNLLIVTDYDFLDVSLSIGTRGWKIIQAPEAAYGGDPRCPYLAVPPAHADHPIFFMLRQKIATNYPSNAFIRTMGEIEAPPWERLLEFPEDVQRAPGGPGKWPGKVWPAYMIGSPKNAPPTGRLLFISGHGMFMNGMMLQTTNDNFAFAQNAVRWLREAPQGKVRSKAMLMVDGKIVTDFNMNLSPRAELPKPQIPIPPARAVNRLIRGMEDEGLIHKILHGLLGDAFQRVVGVIIALATFMLLLYGAKKFLEARHARETAVPSMVGVAVPLGPVVPRGQQRQRALARQADAGAAVQLAHAWLRADFNVQPEQWAANTHVKLQATGFLLTRWGLQSQADWVLSIARSVPAAELGRGDFAELIAAVSELSRAAQTGRLTLQVDGKNVRQVDGR